MSQIHTEGQMSFPAGAALVANRRVKIASGVLQYASTTDVSIGTLLNDTWADSNYSSGYTNGTVQLKISDSTRKMVASGAITAGAACYGTTNGKVTGTANGNVEGIALEAAAADGDVIEVMSSDKSDSELAVVGVAAGYKVARGETALDGSNPTPVTTGLTTCVAFVATLKGSSAPGVGTSTLTAVISGGDANVYAWKVTGSGDTTLIASTGTESFYWVAVGT